MIYYKQFDFSRLNFPTVKGAKRARYINAPLSFDIETSAYNERAFMYIWQFGIDGAAVFGRTWEEFTDFLSRLKNALHVTPTHKAVIYVHNLAYEFAFMGGYLKFKEVFARSPHHPIYATTADGFEFRCSYFLTGKSLEMVSRDTQTKKLVGDLDYSKLRHRNTELTPQELAYCENDVIILNEYIAKEIERNGDITKIPLTKTGYVRREVLNAFTAWDGWTKYKRRLKFDYPDLNTFSLLYKCFAGGFTHANARWVDLTLDNVGSYDIASSYPTQMLKHKYPLGAFRPLKITDRETLFKMCEKYACIMCLSFKGLKAKTDHSIISRHKCQYLQGGVIDNGRVSAAAFVTFYLTSPDFLILQKFYDFESVRIEQFCYAHYNYLPRPMFDIILKLYNDKTLLKGYAEGTPENTLYKLSKEYINSLYGMTVTNPLDDTVIYNNGEWTVEREDAQKLLTKQRNSKKYDLPYSVGVFVTAWARYELLSMVYAITENSEGGEKFSDVVYCDTDSIKLINPEKHAALFHEYNRRNVKELYTALDFHGIDRALISPKNKTIGIFESEGIYTRFKTLGAKRYCVEHGGKFSYTVAGLPKNKRGNKTPLTYMQELAKRRGCDIFDIFEFELHIPTDYACKLMSVYNTEEWRETVTDYKGEPAEVGERFGVGLCPTDFTISSVAEFLAFLCAVQKSDSKILPSLGSKRDELKINPLD